MKKILLLSASCLMLLSACKKDNNAGETKPKPDAKKYDVTFKVDDFSQTVTGYSIPGKSTLAVGDTLKNYVTNLYYRVYDSQNRWVKSIDQVSTLSTFGTIADKLEAGTYQVAIVAARGALSVSGVTSTIGDALYTPTQTENLWDDNTYAKLIPLTVGSSSINQSVRLDRSIGALDVTLTDAIPSNAAKIGVILQNEYYTIMINGAENLLSSDIERRFELTTADIGKTNKKFIVNVANTLTPMQIKIRAYDKNFQVISEKSVGNVRVYKNKRTSLTGTLFPVPSTAATAFTVAVNPAWGTSTSSPITF